MLSDSVNKVELMDIKWAYDTGYEKDEIWVFMNILSLMSNKPRQHQLVKQFKELTGKTMWCPSTSPACDWSGSYDNLLLATSAITCDKQVEKLKRRLNGRIPCNKDYVDFGIRLRRFANVNNNPVVGQSANLKRDEDGRFYMWDFVNNKIAMVPEQLLKENLILWDAQQITKKSMEQFAGNLN